MLASGELTGNVDAVRLHQMFTTLLVNAAQYGGPDQPVVMRAHGDESHITMSVSNHGGTIPADSLESSFQPLVQLGKGQPDDTRPPTSLGLGLFLAREIAVIHGGSLSVTLEGGLQVTSPRLAACIVAPARDAIPSLQQMSATLMAEG